MWSHMDPDQAHLQYLEVSPPMVLFDWECLDGAKASSFHAHPPPPSRHNSTSNTDCEEQEAGADE